MVLGLKLRGQSSGIRAYGSMVQGSEFQGVGLGVFTFYDGFWGLGFGSWGLGCGVWGVGV